MESNTGNVKGREAGWTHKTITLRWVRHSLPNLTLGWLNSSNITSYNRHGQAKVTAQQIVNIRLETPCISGYSYAMLCHVVLRYISTLNPVLPPPRRPLRRARSVRQLLGRVVLDDTCHPNHRPNHHQSTRWVVASAQAPNRREQRGERRGEERSKG